MQNIVFVGIILFLTAFCHAAEPGAADPTENAGVKLAFQHEEGDAVRDVAFSEDNKFIFSFASCGLPGAVADSGRAWVWDRITGIVVNRVDRKSAGESPVISRRPAHVECTNTGTSVRDFLTGKRRSIALRGIDDSFRCRVLSEEHELLVACNPTSTSGRGWDLKTGEPRFRLPNVEHTVAYPYVLSKSGKYLAICFEYLLNKDSDDHAWDETRKDGTRGLIAVWSLSEPRQAIEVRWPHRPYSVGVSADDKTLVFGSWDNDFKPGWINVVDIATGKPLPGFPKKTKYVPACIAFSPDGKHLCWGDAIGATHIMDTRTWQEESVLRIHPEKDDEQHEFEAFYDDCINCIAYSSDGALIATGTNDARIRIWDVKSGKEVTPKLVQKTDGKKAAPQ